MTSTPSPHTPATTPDAATGDAERIKAILEEIRPYLQRDGGDCEFVSYENKVVNLKLHGACGTCPSSLMTLRMGIENAIREQIPDLQMVRNVDQPGAADGQQAHGQQAHGHQAHGHGPEHLG